MTNHGGARSKSGPKPSMFSARSDARNLKAIRLPAEGYDGDFPALSELLPDAVEREGVVWAEAWRSPQAAQWAKEPSRWRDIALWVRWSVKMEDPDAKAATATAAMRIADKIGLSPSGLKENGWIIPSDMDEEKSQPVKRPAKKVGGPVQKSTRRLRSVPNAAG